MSKRRAEACPLRYVSLRHLPLVLDDLLAAARPWRMEKLVTDAVMDASLVSETAGRRD